MTAVASGVFRHPVPDVGTPDSCFIRGWMPAKNCFLSGADEKHRKVVHQACFFHPVTNTKLHPQFPDAVTKEATLLALIWCLLRKEIGSGVDTLKSFFALNTLFPHHLFSFRS